MNTEIQVNSSNIQNILIALVLIVQLQDEILGKSDFKRVATFNKLRYNFPELSEEFMEFPYVQVLV